MWMVRCWLQAEAAAAAATDRRARSRARWDQQGGGAAPNGDAHVTAQQTAQQLEVSAFA